MRGYHPDGLLISTPFLSEVSRTGKVTSILQVKKLKLREIKLIDSESQCWRESKITQVKITFSCSIPNSFHFLMPMSSDCVAAVFEHLQLLENHYDLRQALSKAHSLLGMGTELGTQGLEKSWHLILRCLLFRSMGAPKLF